MSCGVSHRCLTIDMQRMFCQRSTLRVGSSCYIPGVMGHPKNARGCHCVLSLCHLMYCHLPNISLWRLRKFTKSQSHLQQIPPISFILPQLCAHDAFKKSSNNMSPSFSFTHSASDHPSLHPLSSPPAVSGAPGLGCPQHPRRRPRRGAAPRRRLGRCQPPSAAVSHLRRRRARRRQRLAPPRGSPPPTPTLEWKRLESAATIVAGVCEDHQDYDYDLIIPSQAGKIRKATPNWLYAW